MKPNLVELAIAVSLTHVLLASTSYSSLKMLKFPLVCLVIFSALFSGAQANEEWIDSAETEREHVIDSWEYEPRVWSHDEKIQGLEESDSIGESIDQENSVDDGEEADIGPLVQSENVHTQHNYLRPDEVKLRQESSEKGEKCTQFRVDTREAIVCDKNRCDKLDFEWPTYDNQIAVIETTKHGMRFHRADYAFSGARKGPETTYNYNDQSRVKLDIFELFKPKPSTSTQSQPSEPDTTDPSESTSDSNTTNSDQDGSSTPTSFDRETQFNSHDSNYSQLVTTFRLDTRRIKQNMIGFGGALSDSTCRNIKSLSPNMAKSLMEDYFGDRGLRYNIVRMTIGSSDFSTTPYTNNDRPEQVVKNSDFLDERDDVEMNNFRLTTEDYEFKLPIARQAIATSTQEVKFFSSLWSPPTWMKNNSHIVHGYLKGHVYGPYYKALAELMIKWLEAYRKNGIEFWGLTGLNEPVTGVKPFIFHNSVGITRDDYVTFYKLYLGPMLRKRGFQNTKLMMLDDNKGYAPNWVKAMLEDKVVAQYISGIAFHWYMNDEYENLNFIEKKYPDKFILASEACNGFLPFQVHALPGNWDRGVAYMYDIIKMVQKNAAGWVDWNMALDLSGGPSWANNYLDSAILVNANRDEYYKSPMFYAMGHFSRFVEPKSVRLDHRMANARYDYPIEAVGFLTPRDYVVIVALNANRHQVPFKMVVDRQLIRTISLRANSFNTIMFKRKKS